MPDPGRGRLVVARTVYATREAGRWLIADARSGARLPSVPLVESCLDACATPITRNALIRRLQPYPGAIAERVIAALESAGILVDAGARAADDWAPWSAVADWFHHATRDVPIRKGRPAEVPAPSPIRRRRALASHPLPLPEVAGLALDQALASRRTWRRFGRAPLTLADLGTLLGLTFGVQAWAEAPRAGPSALKTSPSGGARHSLEAYVAVRRVAGLAPGLYHYRPDTHRLALLRAECAPREIGRFLPGQPGYRTAAVTCFMATELARVRWRYPNARAYRVVMIEAGHLAQTFALVAAALGLAPFTTGALADSAIEAAFGLSATTCPVVYACGAGVRPRDEEWAPYVDRPAPARQWTRLGLHLREAAR